MKQLLILLLSVLISTAGFSQNGGQYFENNSVKVTVIAKSNGYYAGVTSKQSCISDFKVAYTTTTTINLPANGYGEVFLGTNFTGKVKVKAETQCGNTDYGWVEASLSLVPLTFVGNPIVSYDKTTDYVFIKIAITNVRNVKYLKFRVSFDEGRTKKPIGLVFLDYTNLDAVYTYKIKRTDILKLNN